MYNRRKKIKKLDYSKKKYSNPFFHCTKSNKFSPSTYYWTWKQKISILGILFLILLIIWLLFYFSFFNIKNIVIFGSDKISKTDIQNLVWQQTAKKRYLLASQNNIFIFNNNEFIKILKEAYPVDSLTLEKKLPNRLIINFKEKQYIAVWRENDKYYLLSDDQSTTEVDPLQVKNKNIPMIENIGEPKIKNNIITDQSEKIFFSLTLFQKLKNSQYKIEIEKLLFNDKENNTINVTLKGPTLFFNIKDDMDKQLNKLYAIINNKLKEEFKNKKYIDLRYGDKIYYQ